MLNIVFVSSIEPNASTFHRLLWYLNMFEKFNISFVLNILRKKQYLQKSKLCKHLWCSNALISNSMMLSSINWSEMPLNYIFFFWNKTIFIFFKVAQNQSTFKAQFFQKSIRIKNLNDLIYMGIVNFNIVYLQIKIFLNMVMYNKKQFLQPKPSFLKDVSTVNIVINELKLSFSHWKPVYRICFVVSF